MEENILSWQQIQYLSVSSDIQSGVINCETEYFIYFVIMCIFTLFIFFLLYHQDQVIFNLTL